VIRISVEVTDINDNAPRFQNDPWRTYISEAAIPGVLIPIDEAVDPDCPQNGVVRYGLISVDDEDKKFRLQVERNIDGSHDVNLVLNGTLDREAKDLYQVICTGGVYWIVKDLRTLPVT